ncbi:cilia- and flagella-associated protein 43 [Anopheles nili]|uniref:cilia- and flagella-associated protein 43 n=1 Tax=Anopheles nili TaxID=185578 RepID=UPI00237A9395|nr:cilia- and flagella-associated protein 43 [Anopheles nili]
MEQNVRMKPLWMKPGSVDMACVVGNVAVAVALGGHILFVNLKTSETSHYLADGAHAGNGVACLTGHKLFPILAFAESCVNPRIMLISYPAKTVLSVLEGDQTECTYIALCFSESELLVALTGVPDYSVEVYAWRSKELLYKKSSPIICDNQRLICSPSTVFAVCQYAPRKPELKLWEVHGNIRISRFIERTIQLELEKSELPLCVSFLIDGNLAVVSQKARVFIVSSTTGQISQTISTSDNAVDDPLYIPFILYCKGGLFASAPDGQVNFYKKQKGSWNQLWSTQSDVPYSQLLHYSTSEGLLGITTDGMIMRTLLDADVRNVEFKILKDLDNGYIFHSLSRQYAEKLIGIKPSGTVRLLSLKTGSASCSIDVGPLECIASHPEVTCLAVGNQHGVLQLIVANEDQAKVTARLRLSRSAIVTIVFAIADSCFFAACDEDGHVVIVEVTAEFEMNVLQVLSGVKCTADLFLWCSTEEVLIVQPMNETGGISINEVEFIVRQHCVQEVKRTLLKLPNNYCQIVPKRTGTRMCFYAHQTRTNIIDLLEISRTEGVLDVVLIRTITTLQSVLHLTLCVDDRYLYAWSMDGKITLFDGAEENYLCTMIFDGRFNEGIKQLSLNIHNNHLSILCHSGMLIVANLLQPIPDAVVNEHSSPSQILAFPLTGDEHEVDSNLPPEVEPPTEGTVPWIEKQAIEQRAERGKLYEPEHAAIFAEFADIRQHLQLLVDNNETAPQEERFPLQVFNLNAEATDKITREANVSKDDERRRLQEFIESQSKINDRLIENCWMMMSKKPWKVRSMFKRSFVENYGMMSNSPYRHYMLQIRVYRETELNASYDALLPWKPTPTYQLESILNRDPEYGNVLDKLARTSVKKSYALSGTTTHRFFEPYSLRYDQLEVVTFGQLFFELVCGDLDVEKLRSLFNEKFEQIKTLKNEEMDLVLKRNRRARYVQEELVFLANLMSDRSAVEVTQIEDPKYEADERPDTIIHTEDSEIPVAPYISPSVEQLMDLERKERERRQRELLADDFKDRALVVMMDGVLEHRWEDEIKKSLPLPQCLEIGKDPQHYNETDIREMNEYEEQRKTLHQERLRYRKMLQDELQELAASLDDQIKRFNTSVAKLTLQKIVIESAIRQEEMRILRASLYNHGRLIYEANVGRLRDQIEQTTLYSEQLLDMMDEFQEKAADYRNTYETLRGKDRLLDKQFKINFSDTAQSALVDQAYKIFKRRPKTQLRSIVTVSVFQDMAKRIVAKKPAGPHGNMLLPKECQDYLTHCEALDQASNCPAGMDSSLWQTLVKMRRIKIESEFRLKSCELMLSDAEAAIGAFQREITNKRNNVVSLEQNLEQLHNEQFESATNRTVQLVMKRGWIEIQQSGRTSDFERCVLIHRTDVEDINAIIRRAGTKKLNAMVNAALFRRKIIYQEWEHRALKLQLRDLRDQLATVEKCKITKEVQSWLKMKGMKRTEDFSQVALEKKLRNAIQNEEDALQELKNTLEEIEQRIMAKRRENKHLDQQTRTLNIDVTEQHLLRDTELEQTEQKAIQDRMTAIVERARLVRLVQAQHTQILELGTMLELQRLKTYPTLTASTSVMTHNAHHLLGN